MYACLFEAVCDVTTVTEKYTRKKGASNPTPFFFLCDKCELTAGSDEKKNLKRSPAGSLESLDEREKGREPFFFEMSHRSMHAACFGDHSRRARTFLSFFFFEGRPSPVYSGSLLSNLASFL